MTAPTYSRAKSHGKLVGFTHELELALKADSQRIKQDQRTAKALFLQIKASNYEGCYCRVTDMRSRVAPEPRQKAARVCVLDVRVG